VVSLILPTLDPAAETALADDTTQYHPRGFAAQ
jgi:hypothetical protein